MSLTDHESLAGGGIVRRRRCHECVLRLTCGYHVRPAEGSRRRSETSISLLFHRSRSTRHGLDIHTSSSVSALPINHAGPHLGCGRRDHRLQISSAHRAFARRGGRRTRIRGIGHPDPCNAAYELDGVASMDRSFVRIASTQRPLKGWTRDPSTASPGMPRNG
jgi:hypothetical protein